MKVSTAFLKSIHCSKYNKGLWEIWGGRPNASNSCVCDMIFGHFRFANHLVSRPPAITTFQRITLSLALYDKCYASLIIIRFISADPFSWFTLIPAGAASKRTLWRCSGSPTSIHSFLLYPANTTFFRMMSDYEVSLVNDNMQEFYVRFYGPAESRHSFLATTFIFGPICADTRLFNPISSLCRGCVEDSCWTSRSIPFQIT